MTTFDIEEINDQCPSDQGIFTEPWGIPINIKEPVVYTKYGIGGYRGGSWTGSRAEPYTEEPPKNKFKVLDLVLRKLKPNITYLQYKEIDDLIHTNKEGRSEDYYGNSTDYIIEYIILSELETLLETL
jgi:hypothetical protein